MLEFILNKNMLIIIMLIIMINSLVVFIYLSRKDKDIKLKQKEYDDLQDYNENLEELYMDMRKFRHDYKNILLSLSHYIDEGDIDGLKKYFYSKIYSTNNLMEKHDSNLGLLSNITITELKGLISSKLIKAQELGIDVNVDIAEPIYRIPIEILDLIRTLGILLDNAIEASLKSEKKLIEFAMIKSGASIIIVVINSYEDENLSVPNIFKEGFSTKGSKRGMGLSNLASIFNKYSNVTLDTIVEDGLFKQRVYIDEKKYAFEEE